VAEREDLRAEQDHPADVGGAEIGPYARRVRADQVPLERADVLGRDARLAEGAESGVDAVDARCVIPGQCDGVDGGARAVHLGAHLGVVHDWTAANRHVLEIRKGQPSPDVYRFHGVRGVARAGPGLHSLLTHLRYEATTTSR